MSPTTLMLDQVEGLATRLDLILSSQRQRLSEFGLTLRFKNIALKSKFWSPKVSTAGSRTHLSLGGYRDVLPDLVQQVNGQLTGLETALTENPSIPEQRSVAITFFEAFEDTASCITELLDSVAEAASSEIPHHAHRRTRLTPVNTMAEPLSAPFVMLDLTLATIAAAAKLRDLLKSFHSYRLHNLLQELDTLNGALGSLRDTIEATSDTDFSALNIPLQRCGEACLNFEEEVLLCLARTGDNRTSFRDWVKIKYMGEDIDSFKELLASYRLTISIAITDAKLRRNSAPAENIASFNDLIVTAKANLERRLKNIDERLEVALTMDVAATERTAREAQLIKEERLSTEKCLQISAEVSDHIAQIQLATNNCSAQETSVSTNELPEQIMREGLQECRDTLARTASRLEEHEKQLFARLLDEPRTMIPSEEDRVNLARMRDDWEAIRRSMDICSFAVEHAHHNCNTNNMWATDDAIQIMVCTGAKTIHGVNRGGWRTRQIGGYVDQDVLEGIFKALSSMAPSLPVEGAT